MLKNAKRLVIIADTMIIIFCLSINVSASEIETDGITTADLIWILEDLDNSHNHCETNDDHSDAHEASDWMMCTLEVDEFSMSEQDMGKVCTREDAAFLMYKFARHFDLYTEYMSEDEFASFNDVDYIDEDKIDAVSWALHNEILVARHFPGNPYTHHDGINAILPKKTLTVADFNEMLFKFVTYMDNTPACGEKVVDFARQYLGCDYVWGGKSPNGFDCSGLIYYVFSSLGYDVGQRTTAAMYNKHIGESMTDQYKDENGKINWEIVPIGSVICFDWDHNGKADHIGLWTGESLLHASGSKTRQYAKNGNMVREDFIGEGDGMPTSRDNAFDEGVQRGICAIKSFDSLYGN